MDDENKIFTFIILAIIGIVSFSIGVAHISSIGLGWMFAGCGFGGLTFGTLAFIKYLEND